jgi:hypothetical protein
VEGGPEAARVFLQARAKEGGGNGALRRLATGVYIGVDGWMKMAGGRKRGRDGWVDVYMPEFEYVLMLDEKGGGGCPSCPL